MLSCSLATGWNIYLFLTMKTTWWVEFNFFFMELLNCGNWRAFGKGGWIYLRSTGSSGGYEGVESRCQTSLSLNIISTAGVRHGWSWANLGLQEGTASVPHPGSKFVNWPSVESVSVQPSDCQTWNQVTVPVTLRILIQSRQASLCVALGWACMWKFYWHRWRAEWWEKRVLL